MAQHISQDKQNQLKTIAVQAKRQLTLQNKKKRLQEDIPQAPTMLNLSELASKTNLPYSLLRKMIVENGFVPFYRVGRKILINYELFVQKLGQEKEV